MIKNFNKKSFIAIILIVVTLAMTVGITYSWLTHEVEVVVRTADNVQIKTNIEGVKISLGNGTYSSAISFTSDVRMVDITGDGENFLFPTYLDFGDTSPADAMAYKELSEATKDGYFISFTLNFRTSDAIDIYLENDSYVLPRSYDYDENGNLVWNGDNASKYGNFRYSADGIAGAARVAFLAEEDVEVTQGKTTTTQKQFVLKNIWVPNPFYEFNATQNTFKIDGTLEKFGTTDYNYGYLKLAEGKSVGVPYTTEDYLSGKVSVGNGGLASASSQRNGTKLLSFEGSDEPVEKKLKVVVWVEGTDREAHTNLNGGMLKYFFQFAGHIDTAPTTEVLKDFSTLHYNDSDQKLYYTLSGGTEAVATNLMCSRDGLIWQDYGDDPTTTDVDEAKMEITNANPLYVRFKGDSTYSSSEIKKLPWGSH